MPRRSENPSNGMHWLTAGKDRLSKKTNSQYKMNRIFMPDLDAKERIRIMQENAFKVETGQYQRNLTQDELDERREKLAENFIHLDAKMEELKAIKDEFKAALDPVKAESKKLLSEIKTKQETCDGSLFYLPNHEDSMMEVYNEKGELIHERRLRPDEKQGVLFQITKTGTI